jgi:hypothetical protein
MALLPHDIFNEGNLQFELGQFKKLTYVARTYAVKVMRCCSLIIEFRYLP